MALTNDQKFFGDILWFLLRGGEDFRIMYQGKEYMNIGTSIYENGKLLEQYEGADDEDAN